MSSTEMRPDCSATKRRYDDEYDDDRYQYRDENCNRNKDKHM